MTPDELRAILNYLRERVQLTPTRENSAATIVFKDPEEEEMIEAGLNPGGVKRILRVPWFGEMVADILETPALCDPEDPPEQVLEYARDVVSEYIRKRFPLSEE